VTIASFVPRAGISVRSSNTGGELRVLPPLDRDGSFPADGVAFRVVYQSGLPPLPASPSATHLPLTAAAMKLSSGPAQQLFNATTGEVYHSGRYFGAPRSRAQIVRAADQQYDVVVWIGPHASQSSRTAMTHMVQSLRFP
jgi:hypothetical protein